MLSRLSTFIVSLRNALRQPTDPTECTIPLQRDAIWSVDFDAFAKGIDNVHIDVRLSPQFIARARHVVASMLDQQVGEDKWGVKSPGPTRGEWEEFRGAYGRMVEPAIHRAKSLDQPIIVALVQFASMRFLLELVQTELELRRQGFRASLGSGAGLSDALRVQITERLTWLARNRARLRYQVNRQLVEQLMQVETGTLRELRRSLLGNRDIVPDAVLFNPLLQAESAFDDDVMMKEYVLLAQEAEHPYSPSAIEEFLAGVFRRRSPVHPKELALVAAERRVRDAGEEFDRYRRKAPRATRESDTRLAKLETLVDEVTMKCQAAQTQYDEVFYAWADSPANADILFDARAVKERLKAGERAAGDGRAVDVRAHLRWQRRLLEVVEQRFHEKRLMRHVVAAYATVPLHKEYGSVLSAQELYQFLSGDSDRREVIQRMRERTAGGKPIPLDSMLKTQKRVASMSHRKQREYLVHFLRDYLTYRRDLGYYRAAAETMNRIHVQDDPESIRLSRDNRTLYEFLSTQEEGAVARTICGHVVVKADVRGSTTMIAELRHRGLNPASHFSLNFFDPIRELLDLYGARMVFIEGDAVILSLLEHEETVGSRVAVARACGLARELLSVVERQNAYSKRNGLPELEVGIGIVYVDEAPSFLYAGETQIMVSPAIGKADRLSSCSWVLRKQRGTKAGRNVEVYEIPPTDPLYGEKGEVHLRYNVNGIELDAPAFAKLKSEIVLQRIEAVIPGETAPSVFHTGRYPDQKGVMHYVVVREDPIRPFSRTGETVAAQSAAKFFEVVADLPRS